jgi:AcrR family transcriptional regulator
MTAAGGRREETREGILEAAVRCFTRNGYRRTAMDQVARDAGISRAAVYLHFPNKEALFRALVGGLHDASLVSAKQAAAMRADLAARVYGILEAKSVRFFTLLRGSVHAAEFLDENHRLCGALSAAPTQGERRVLNNTLADADAAGEIGLARAGLKPAQAAELLLDVADGIKTRGHESMTTAQYQQRLAEAVRVVLAGLGVRARRPGAGTRGARPRGAARQRTRRSV